MMCVSKHFRQRWGPNLWALGSGLLMGSTSAPLEAWYFAWVALIPLWVLILKHTAGSGQSEDPRLAPQARAIAQFWTTYRAFGWWAFCWGLGYQGVTLFWITGIHPMTWMGVPWMASLAIAIICWLMVTLWGAGIPLLWAAGMTLYHLWEPCRRRTFAWQLLNVLYGAGLWCVIEYFWSQSPLFWHFLAFSQSPHNLILLQLAQISGFTMISWVILLVNGCLAAAWVNYAANSKAARGARIFLGLALGSLLLFHGLGWLLWQQQQAQEGESVQIGIIQGNIPNTIKLYEEGAQLTIARYQEGYQQLAQQSVDFVITPETALPFSIEQVLRASSWPKLIKAKATPIMLGAFGSEGQNFTNSLFTLVRNGQVLSRYNKQQLVPLGEYIPLESFLGQFINRLSPLEARLVRGQNPTAVPTPLGLATVAICYESAYPEHFRRQTAAGGTVIIVASNDAHYSPAMPAQHHALDVMQAIANGRWLVRANNTGHSGVVSPWGETFWLSKLNKYVTHQGEIVLLTHQTLYVRWGNWFVKLLGLSLVLILGWGRSPYRKHDPTGMVEKPRETFSKKRL